MTLLASPLLVTIVGILGNMISFIVFLTPIRTFYRIYKKKCTQGFKAVPYSVALFSCALLFYYGYLKPSGGLMIMTINSIGCVIEAIYLTIFLVYAPKAKKAKTAKLLCGFNLGVYGAICLTTYFLFKDARLRVTIVGWMCAIFSVLVFAAPLSVMRLVIKSKSAEYMSFGLSLSLTICAVIWFFYGILIRDYYIAMPNVLGFILGVTQMIFCLIFRKPKEKILPDERKSPEKIKNIELTDGLQKPIVARKSPDHAISIDQESDEEVVEEIEYDGNKVENRAVVAEPERMVDIHQPIPVAACV